MGTAGFDERAPSGRPGGLATGAGRWTAALCAALLLAGCARLLPGGQRCPAHGGAPWREYRSAHFVLFSDLDREAAAAIVQEVESIRAMELAALDAEDREIPGRLRVVAPAREKMYRAMAPPDVLGYYLVSGLGEPTIVLHAAALPRDPEVFAHELAHSIAWHLYPRQPRWFTEGLAQFVQTVASPDPERRGWAGRVPRAREGRGGAPSPQVPAKELLAWKGGTTPAQTHARERWSWILYHWLWSERPRQLADFQRRLAAAAEPATAWVASFPDLDPASPGALDALDHALERHRRRTDLPARRVNVDASGAFSEAPVSSADVHVLLVEARGYWEVSAHQARSGAARSLGAAAGPDLREALQEDPFQPRAVSRIADLDGEPAIPALRAVSAARPGDWSAWFLLGDALEDAGDLAESEAAYRKAAALNGDNAPTQNNLAWVLATSGRPAEALPFARRAVELAPWDPNTVDTLALVMDGLGSCPDALRLQRRASDLLQDENDEIRAHLVDYERRCGREAQAGAEAP